MNFTIERAAFLTAAKRAAQLAPSTSPLEVLKCALLEIDTETRSLHMTATNMEVTLRQDVPLLAVLASPLFGARGGFPAPPQQAVQRAVPASAAAIHVRIFINLN